MTDEFPPYRYLEEMARTGNLHKMHKILDSAYSGTDTVSDGEYRNKDYDVDKRGLEGQPVSWSPTEIHVRDRTPADDERSEALREHNRRNAPQKGPLSDVEKDRRVGNINANNAELGLKTPKEMISPAGPKSVQMGTSVKATPEGRAVANRFIEGS